MKSPFIIYSSLESIIKKMSTRRQNNREKPSAIKINKHTPSGYSLFTHCSYDATRNKLDCYRGKDCMKRFLRK